MTQDVIPQLTGEERHKARILWRDLMVHNRLDPVIWHSASRNVHNAVRTAMIAAYDLAMLQRQKVSYRNPFDGE